jgi:PhoPQ-activated pathogenicity-related protein
VSRRRVAAIFAMWLSVIASCRAGVTLAGETALDRYVTKPDGTYSWRLVTKSQKAGGSQIVVQLKSQTWRSVQDVDRPVWQHWLTILKPKKPASTTAFLFIGGGSNGPSAPATCDPLVTSVSEKLGVVAVELHVVPNQPLVFDGDGAQRKEDDLICYTWDRFLKGGDEEWPARLPMVKSAVRAMDCVQQLMANEPDGSVRIEKFVVAGGSKRGWTAWCTAAVDRRVAAFVPAVIDCVNFVPSLAHQASVYGFYGESLGDYLRQGIMRRLKAPRMKLLLEIEDPYTYRDRYTMPKYVVSASGDQYFCPDSSRFYYDELPGDKYLRYVPNTDHSLGGSDARESIVAFHYTIVSGKPRPKYSWSFERDGSIRVVTSGSPREVTLWQATNPVARDFRIASIGKAYKSRRLIAQGMGVYVAPINKPKAGWTASFIELTFDVGAPFPFKVSTAVRVTPDTLPHEGIDSTLAPYEGRLGQER